MPSRPGASATTTMFGRVNAYQLPASSPEAQGVDPSAIRALVEAWEGNGVRPFALTIIRQSRVRSA